MPEREHDDPRYIVDLIKRVTRVSVETMKTVDALPELPVISPSLGVERRASGPRTTGKAPYRLGLANL